MGELICIIRMTPFVFIEYLICKKPSLDIFYIWFMLMHHRKRYQTLGTYSSFLFSSYTISLWRGGRDYLEGICCISPLGHGLWKRELSTRTPGSIRKVPRTCPQHKTIEFEVQQIPSSEIGKNLHAFLNIDNFLLHSLR